MLTAQFSVNGHVIGRLEVVNDGLGSGSKAGYDVTLFVNSNATRQVRHARVDDWPRSRPAWRLVLEALRRIEESGS